MFSFVVTLDDAKKTKSIITVHREREREESETIEILFCKHLEPIKLKFIKISTESAGKLESNYIKQLDSSLQL